MNEHTLQQRFLDYMKSDDAAYDLVKVSKTFMREVFERGYRAGHAEGLADATRKESPDPEAAHA